MRDIKFRCWDGKKMWKYAVPMLGSGYNGKTIEVSNIPSGSDNEYVNGELLQWTGLTDRNGVPIYEGDIVRFMDCDDDVYVSDVRFDEGGWTVYVNKWYTPYIGNVYDIEVLGNKYEHPHLMGE